MTQKWNTAAYAKPDADTQGSTHLIDLDDGVDTAVTHYYGTADPSSGAGWGAPELGVIWIDSTNVMTGGGDDLGVVVKRWEVLTTTPTYGWRTLDVRRYVALEPNVNVLALTSQAAGSFTALDLTASASSFAIAAKVMVTVDDVTPGTAVFAALRKYGTTTDAQERRVYPQVASLPTSVMLDVELDAGQQCEYQINASAASACGLRVDVLGYWERG